MTLGKLFLIFSVLMKNECLNRSVLADFNIIVPAGVASACQSALSRYRIRPN